MASRTSRREWVRGLPWGFGVGRYDRKQIHSVSERSVGYGFLIGKSVQNHPNPHLYQTGSKDVQMYFVSGFRGISLFCCSAWFFSFINSVAASSLIDPSSNDGLSAAMQVLSFLLRSQLFQILLCNHPF